MAFVSEGEYKWSPMIILTRDVEDKFPFQFGLKKAKLILECLTEIQEFVKKHTPEEA